MKLKTSKLFGFFGILICVPLLFFGIMFYIFISTPVTPTQAQKIVIKQGASFFRIADQLEQAGVVTDARKFVWLARWRDATAKVQAGEYLFAESANPRQVLQRIVNGDVIKIQVTFPEGLNLVETAQRAAAGGVGTTQEFLQIATRGETLGKYDINADTLEGYLFPETYTIQSTTTPGQLIEAMVTEFNKHMTPVILDAAAEHGLGRHELVTLASIIQKEAGNEAEMPLISAVFHNRLKRGIALQADPTVIYGIKDFDGNLTRKHLEAPSPYNTYRNRGLPPGPIANPGKSALEAAAFPADVNYLYFVSRGDGTHEFNVTLKQHNRAVRRYQLLR